MILINDHMLNEHETLKIPGFVSYSSHGNPFASTHRGNAILVKRDLSHKIIEDFATNLLAVIVETRQGPIILATDYLNPGLTHIHPIDYNFLINRQEPMYLIGDLNAVHPVFGSTRSPNHVGRNLNTLIEQDKLRYVGPHFPTYTGIHGTSTPDIILTNNRAYHNIRAYPGPNTSSDHTPIIVKITVNPIAIPIAPRPQFAKANWDRFKEILSNVPPLTWSTQPLSK